MGAHTRSHPDLRRLAPERVEEEAGKSRVGIEDRLNHAVDSFAYPYDSVSEVVASIAARDFRAACVTELRCATSESLHALPRVDVYYLRQRGRLRQLLDGRLNRYLMIRRWRRRVRAAVSR